MEGVAQRESSLVPGQGKKRQREQATKAMKWRLRQRRSKPCSMLAQKEPLADEVQPAAFAATRSSLLIPDY